MGLDRKVLTNLEDIANDYDKLLDLVEAKREAVHNRDIDRLEEINEKEEMLLGELRELHERREELWRRKVDLEPEVVTLEQVMDNIPELLANKMEELQKEIKQKVQDIQLLTEQVANSLNDRLNVHERMFSSLYDSVESTQQEDDTYDQQGQKENQADKPSVVIDEAV